MPDTDNDTAPMSAIPVIRACTRADAIRDGLLVDVSTDGREVGFNVPVCLTTAVHDQCVRWTAEDARKRRQRAREKAVKAQAAVVALPAPSLADPVGELAAWAAATLRAIVR